MMIIPDILSRTIPELNERQPTGGFEPAIWGFHRKNGGVLQWGLDVRITKSNPVGCGQQPCYTAGRSIHKYVYMYSDMYKCVYTCMYVCLSVCMYVCMYVCMHVGK